MALNLTVLLVIFSSACTYLYLLKKPSVKELTDFSEKYESMKFIEQRLERRRAYGARFFLLFSILVIYGWIVSYIAELIMG